MKKITLKTLSFLCSAVLLLTALGGCSNDSEPFASSTSADEIFESEPPSSDTKQTQAEPSTEQTENSPSQTTESEAQPTSKKLTIFDKEYSDVNEFLREEIPESRTDIFQMAKYFFQGDRENLKQYFALAEDFEKTSAIMPKEDIFKDLIYLEFDYHRIYAEYDEQGRKTIGLSFNYICGGYPQNEKLQYLDINLVQNTDSHWAATYVGDSMIDYSHSQDYSIK